MKRIIGSSLIAIFLSVTSFAQSKIEKEGNFSGYTGGYSVADTVPEDAFTFLALGDFGRVGAYHQKDVAQELGRAAMSLDAQFIVSVGDNFYPSGVGSTQDYHWRSSFEEIYTHPNLYEDWFAVLGNHDYSGSIQAQIDYSNVSRRWNMPDTYYKKTFTLEDGSKLLMLFIDTNPFIDNYHSKPNKYPDLVRQDTAKQMNWIIENLSDNDPTIAWKIVVGHHPMYSGGKRKNSEDTKMFESKFAAIFDQYGVHAYICGHEHDLQVIRPKGRFTTQFLSGSASEIRPTGNREGTLFAAAEPGFMSFSIMGNTMLVQSIQAKGKDVKKLHQITINNK